MSDRLPFYLTWAAQKEAPPLEIAEAREDFFVLGTGHKVHDLLSTSFQASFGHSHEGIRNRIREQTQSLMVTPARADFELKSRATRKLHELLRLTEGKTFYTVSGAESVENALKMARQFTGRSIVCARHRSYHGASLGALSVTGDWRRDDHIFFDPSVVRIPEPTDDPDGRLMRDVVTEHGPERIAAIIVETITGANGVVTPPPSWWRTLGELRAEFGIQIILDEVLTGFGRTGHDFAFHQFEITPDFVTLAKAITGGYVPFGAVWTHPNIAEFYEARVLSCGLTSYAHPLGLAAMEAVIAELTDSRFRGHSALLADTFEKELGAMLLEDAVRKVRQAGLLGAIDFVDGMCPTYKDCLRAGIHVLVREERIILAPPLIMKPSTLRECMSALKALIRKQHPPRSKKSGQPHTS